MKTPTVIVLLLAAAAQAEAEEATLCGGQVSLTSDNWGQQGETFNASLVIENLTTTTATTFSLSPLWDKLIIRPDQVSISTSEHYETTITMLADQFYLYSVNISCDDGTRTDSAMFEVRTEDTQGWTVDCYQDLFRFRWGELRLRTPSPSSSRGSWPSA